MTAADVVAEVLADEPNGAVQALVALERAVAAADPLPPFADAYATVLRCHAFGRLSGEARRAIAAALVWAEVAVAKVLPADFDPMRLGVATDTLAALLIVWAEPERLATAAPGELNVHLLNARICRNDLDSLCARRELGRIGALRPPAPSKSGAALGTIH